MLKLGAGPQDEEWWSFASDAKSQPPSSWSTSQKGLMVISRGRDIRIADADYYGTFLPSVVNPSFTNHISVGIQ